VELGRSYLELVLRFRQLAPTLVEGYTGPPEIAARVESEPQLDPRELASHARELQHFAEHEPELDRREWLGAQLAGVATACSWLAGERLSYCELVKRCHGVNVTVLPEEQFELAHRRLDLVLSGHGTVRERYQTWVASQFVPAALLESGLRALADELGQRSRAIFDLPEGEEVIFELVSGKPWAGNADCLGRLRTRIAINTDLPIASLRLLELVSHEAYPGHHAEHACKDAELIAGRGRLELAAYVYPTPQSLLSEGIACLALDALLGDEAEEIAARCLQPLGIPHDVEVAAAVREAQRSLLGGTSNIAIMLDEERMTTEQARAYARRWMLEANDQVDRSVKSLEDRVWRPYESCYPAGLEVCRSFTAGDPTPYRRLLHEQLTPARLL
jgi:hypothetical protein